MNTGKTFEVACRKCGAILAIEFTVDATKIYKCGCESVVVRVDGCVARVSEFLPNASHIIQ